MQLIDEWRTQPLPLGKALIMRQTIEPNPKRVEQFQQVVIQFGCETERRTQWPGPKLPDTSMRDVGVVIQAI
ncbi:hypothetical protein OF122_02020 [Pelagibacterium flavum]|uniref:Uncharacterized protein n=1 Tax=Pelagibacterium flavum TaxID=2984530 RepID=A0ABY6IUT2_9HYPH|nr:hypothetical protein [Pelagibacterium sp. YIM 151497]UYQ74204.1 hypothetical protein OF122_02020 [Pelagibacterium sp. YIM 151497]